nr:Multidrug resistance protein MdtK [uncultured bacterium]
MFLFSGIRKEWNVPNGYREILRIGFPLIVGMLSTTLMQFFDRLFLSHYSVASIAAAAPAAYAYMTPLFFLMGIVSYTSVIVAQYTGSQAPHRVGPAVWQGVWCAVFGGLLLANLLWIAKPLFAFADHAPEVQRLEVLYFSILSCSGVLPLLNSALSCFFTGRGETRPVLIANITATVMKIPLDLLLIFGFGPIPDLGIAGAGIATIIATSASVLMLASLAFKRENEARYFIWSQWRFQWDMFKRLLRFGLPSGFNMMLDLFVSFVFIMKVGVLGKVPLAASNIAMALNSPVFMPMLGLNLAVAILVGQSMGAGKHEQVPQVTRRCLTMAFMYMAPMACFLAIFAGPLIGLFAPSGISAEEFIPVKEVGTYLIYYVAVYSLVDAASIIYFGALKGGGDTRGIMYIMLFALTFVFFTPLKVIELLDKQTIHTFWIVMTVYIMFLAMASTLRFKQGKWRSIRVVETAKGVVDDI